MARGGQCRTCRGIGKIGEMRSRLQNGQLLIVEVRRKCFTCQGKGHL